MTDFPYRYDVTHTTAEIVEAHGDLEAGAETEVVVTIAGRLMLRRVQGKLAFGTLQDGGGRIQLFAPGKVTPDFDRFCAMRAELDPTGRFLNPHLREVFGVAGG